MRVLGHTPSTLATLSESMKVIKDLAEGRETTYNGTKHSFPGPPATVRSPSWTS